MKLTWTQPNKCYSSGIENITSQLYNQSGWVCPKLRNYGGSYLRYFNWRRVWRINNYDFQLTWCVVSLFTYLKRDFYFPGISWEQLIKLSLVWLQSSFTDGYTISLVSLRTATYVCIHTYICWMFVYKLSWKWNFQYFKMWKTAWFLLCVLLSYQFYEENGILPFSYSQSYNRVLTWTSSWDFQRANHCSP